MTLVPSPSASPLFSRWPPMWSRARDSRQAGSARGWANCSRKDLPITPSPSPAPAAPSPAPSRARTLRAHWCSRLSVPALWGRGRRGAAFSAEGCLLRVRPWLPAYPCAQPSERPRDLGDSVDQGPRRPR